LLLSESRNVFFEGILRATRLGLTTRHEESSLRMPWRGKGVDTGGEAVQCSNTAPAALQTLAF
jgi:hypothetical protein